MLWLTLQAATLTTSGSPTALLQPLSPAAKLRQLGGLLLGSALLMDDRAWELLLTDNEKQFSEIAAAALVAPSSRDASGLFAAKDLPIDTVVSFYPVHSIGLLDQRLASNADDQAFWKAASAAYQTPLQHKAVQDFAPGAFVDCNPQKPEMTGWLAHRANDAVCCLGTGETDMLSYLHTCAMECNCYLVPFGGAAPILALVTNREITRGDELLWSYGHEHWATKREEGLEEGDQGIQMEELTAAVVRALDAFKGERARCLETLQERYQAEIETFEGMILLAADDMMEKQAAAAQASAAPAAERVPRSGPGVSRQRDRSTSKKKKPKKKKKKKKGGK